jgi:starch synthase (maltosyl-transferring)
VTFTRERVTIQRVRPEVAQGRRPAKATVGREVPVRADLVCDSHDVLAGVVRWRAARERRWREAPLTHLGNDRWAGSFVPEEIGRYRFTVEAWVDHLATWRRDLATRHAAGAVEEIDLRVGASLLDGLVDRCRGATRRRIEEAGAALLDADLDLDVRVAAGVSPELAALTAAADPRTDSVRYHRTLELDVDRERAAFSTWYELFPRSASTRPRTHGTLRDVVDRLDHVADLGFDVLYLPPIHPIGTTHRKGRDNATVAGPDDPGSPWAIGSEDGGHKTIHPELGTFADLAALREAAADRGIELALDIAFQCSPDHPYVTEHPEWFRRRPDGSIQYAENPPKKYQDIYPFDFETEDVEGLWTELRSIFEFWIEQGIAIFRVDNPHTKSLAFWDWCLEGLRREHPEVIFLAEAFTRPKMMYELAVRGFTQSYTYFTWRRAKWEIEEYYTELTATDVVDFFRPNSWPNTPDILTDQLQSGTRGMYVQRLVLAATLTANYGMYGPAFELQWSEAREGSEEYLHNEKYEIKRWDVDHPDSLREVIALINRLRHGHPALQQDRNLTFHHVDNDALVAYSKVDDAGRDVVLVIVNLDPDTQHAGTTWLDLEALGIDDEQASFEVADLLGGGVYRWQGRGNYVQLDPRVLPAHVFEVRYDEHPADHPDVPAPRRSP